MLIAPLNGSGVNGVCKRCEEIDREIHTYRHLRSAIDDRLALVLIDEVISDLKSEKAALHPKAAEQER